MKKETFRAGSFYEDSSHNMLSVIGYVDTTKWGFIMMAETDNGCLIPLLHDRYNIKNYNEIKKEKWLNRMGKNIK